MTKPEQNPDAMTEPVAPQETEPSPGQTLRAAREAAGLSQAQVGETLHLTVHYVNAIEHDLYQKLPGRTFAKGYLRSYAKLLGGIDVNELLGRFERLMDAREATREADYQVIRRRRYQDQNGRWMVVAACLLVAVLGTAWWFGRDDAPAAVTLPRVALEEAANTLPDQAVVTPADAGLAPQAAFNDAPEGLFESTLEGAAAMAPEGVTAESAVAGAPQAALAGESADSGETGTLGAAAGEGSDASLAASQNEATVANSPAAPLASTSASTPEGGRQINLDAAGDDTLVVNFKGTSWLAVRDGGNSALFNDNLHSGDELVIHGEAPFNLVIGDAHQVEIEFNARAVDLVSHIRSDRTARLSLQP